MNKYSILCPTRGRAERARRYAKSVFETAEHPERVELLFYVDVDDKQIEDYRLWIKESQFDIHLTVGEPISISKSWNLIAQKSTGNILMMGNDDLVHETAYWDSRLDQEIEKFPDEIYCMWVNDKHKGEKLCTFPIVSRKWYEVVGCFAPGIFEFFYNDTWVQDLGKRIGRLHYVADVIIEHCHFSYGYTKDETSWRNRAGDAAGRSTRDSKVFKDNEDEREKIAERLRKVMQ